MSSRANKILLAVTSFLSFSVIVTMLAFAVNDVHAGVLNRHTESPKPTMSNGIIQHMNTAGIQKCGPAIQALSAYLIGAHAHASTSTWAPTNADGEMFTSISEVKFNDGTMIIDMTVTPTAAGSCSAVFQKIFHSNMNCSETTQLFKNDRYIGSLMDTVGLMINTDPAVKTLLMDVNGGCMVVRKEAIRDVNEVLKTINKK